MSVARATTPTFICTFDEDGLDLTTAHNVYVTFEQRTKSLTKSGDDIEVEPKQITIYLNQAETLEFSEGKIEVQANWTMANGRRACSEVVFVVLSKQLLRRVVE